MLTNPTPSPETNKRKTWMSVLAKADWQELEQHWQNWPDKPEFTPIRPAETGLVMLRGRMGGSGDPFNLGETTVTRCSIRTDRGDTGHAYIMGRNRAHAEVAALCDALLQDPDHSPAVQSNIIEPLAQTRAEKLRTQASKTAATKVEFFTMVRGEDEE